LEPNAQFTLIFFTKSCLIYNIREIHPCPYGLKVSKEGFSFLLQLFYEKIKHAVVMDFLTVAMDSHLQGHIHSQWTFQMFSKLTRDLPSAG